MADHRQYFARIRTQMANERTLMAYYRASLSLLGISAFVFKFFEFGWFTVLSALFLITSIALALQGTRRYLINKNKILKKSPHGD